MRVYQSRGVPLSSSVSSESTSERWRRLKELFAAAVELSPDERIPYVELACGDDRLLRDELLALLAADERADYFIDRPAAEEFLREQVTLDRIGPYRLVYEIGRGGMGNVYLAIRDDGEVDRKVAIKVVRRGMDTDDIVRRFRNERQILARLDHPNIARFLDGGTTRDGLPYFVMEYIEGEAIDQYCERHHLSVQERLRLLLPVFAAVQYAHQNLVIHRDLKPANILVTRDGVPKLLDFGIAKILESETDAPQTATELRMLTPDYASPEQVSGKPVTTSADVFSLGVILYELLSLERPFNVAGRKPLEIVKAVCETEPERPSVAVVRNVAVPGERERSLQKRLRGDLDNIILMALRKDPTRRYLSVESLADDIERYLEGLPVAARRNAFGYHAAKFVTRNRVPVAAGLFFVLTLVASLVVTTRAAAVARAERERAEKSAEEARERFNDVRGLTKTLLFDLHDEVSTLPGGIKARQMVARTALRYIDVLAEAAKDDPVLQRELATAYRRVGSITFNIEQELRYHKRAVDITRSLAKNEPANPALREELALSLAELANTYKMSGDIGAALRSFEEAVAISEGLRSAYPREDRYAAAAADYLRWYADVHMMVGNASAAYAPLQRAGAIQGELVQRAPRDFDRRRDLYSTRWMTGAYYFLTRDYARAIATYNAALEEAVLLANENPTDARVLRDLWVINRRLGAAHGQAGDTRWAIEHMERALGIIERLAGADPADLGHRHAMALTRAALGEYYAREGRLTQARTQLRNAADAMQALTSADPRHAEFRDDRRVVEEKLRKFERQYGP